MNPYRLFIEAYAVSSVLLLSWNVVVPRAFRRADKGRARSVTHPLHRRRNTWPCAGITYEK